MYAGYERNNVNNKIQELCDNLTYQLTYIGKFPQILLRFENDGKTYSPAANDLIKWDDVNVNKDSYNKVFKSLPEDSFNPIPSLLNMIKEEEGLFELKYKDLMPFISQYAQLSLDRFSILIEAYQESFKKIEYKLLGILEINKALLFKVGVSAFTSVAAYLLAYAQGHMDI